MHVVWSEFVQGYPKDPKSQLVIKALLLAAFWIDNRTRGTDIIGSQIGEAEQRDRLAVVSRRNKGGRLRLCHIKIIIILHTATFAHLCIFESFFGYSILDSRLSTI